MPWTHKRADPVEIFSEKEAGVADRGEGSKGAQVAADGQKKETGSRAGPLKFGFFRITS